ncbi:hypothetical protein [Bacteroides sp. 519]|uniref:hypothetical protein n=1 Tax=Bacteroides sp. 519 TaxID=2302937 RepID=UPI0013CFAD8B|nr:hypothetical protein [Bacteroides sp. 519]NDV59387.1 hypothetical protein [Bacteroides sp. 519]
MKIITTREFRQETKAMFELAEKEKVYVKRGKNKYISLVVTDDPEKMMFTKDWVKEFLAIPSEFRCDPFDYSPSGDLFYADRRNVEHLEKSIEQVRNGKTKKLSKEEQDEFLGLK